MDSDSSFPCSINLHIPFPTPRLASTALKALQVDPELSPLVRRTLSVVAPTAASPSSDAESQTQTLQAGEEGAAQVLLRVEYRAATNRMLRVAVNSFMEGLKLVVEVMEQLDVDVLAAAGGEQRSSIQAS
ncbi:Pcc1-domain-containing protein [Trichoderma longibrachiatum ATCC 18648]|uniref:Pcc1-domain-containing protein n=1 Tax=Trichoderma longibrachiatum ATCC 18648 TaxID=983965 RepID=A0A2T4CDL1_TRILO|nr:Pcc1-domain-containing protein [Trichoderma longibrachiatum ATCC 18648]